MCHSRNPRILARNFAAFPKALWLAGELRRMRAEHVHACWAAVAATMAMIASEFSNVPWSFTAHSWDIRECNMLSQKIEAAAFTRVISRFGLETIHKQVGDVPRLRLIHMGVTVPPVAVPDRCLWKGRILIPGSLLPVKGHEYALQALAMLRAGGMERS